MSIRSILITLGKVLLGAIVYELGVILGGVLVTALRLPPPTPPPGADMAVISRALALTAPLYIIALALLAERMTGGFVVRGLSLSLLTWIAYTVNTQLEASIVSSYATSRGFAILSGGVAALFAGGITAALFRPRPAGEGAAAWVRQYLRGRTPGAWVWRVALAAVIFMPIYFVFGLMVLPFTGTYYQQNLYGLAAPTLGQLLPILLTRSLLFLVACWPVLILWRHGRAQVWWRLSLSLFLLVGFNIMLIAIWLPMSVRLPHLIEILADETVYAAALVWLLMLPGSDRVGTRGAGAANAGALDTGTG
jgi:hypothetical protein